MYQHDDKFAAKGMNQFIVLLHCQWKIGSELCSGNEGASYNIMMTLACTIRCNSVLILTLTYINFTEVSEKIPVEDDK